MKWDITLKRIQEIDNLLIDAKFVIQCGELLPLTIAVNLIKALGQTTNYVWANKKKEKKRMKDKDKSKKIFSGVANVTGVIGSNPSTLQKRGNNAIEDVSREPVGNSKDLASDPIDESSSPELRCGYRCHCNIKSQ